MLKMTYILVILLFVGVNLLKSGFRDYDLSFVQMMQGTHCIQSPVCVNTSIDVNTFMEEEEFLPFSSPNISSKIPFPDPVPPLMNDGTCCKGCSCDLDRCTLSGTCCPDLLEYLPSLDESASKIKIVCQKASLKKNRSHDLPVGLNVWMFTRCPDDYTDEVTKEKCENPEEFAGWDTKIPVVHARPILHNNYQNIHCALCHNVSRTNLINWEVAVYCSKGELLPSSIETILDEVRLAEYCNIVYKYPLQYDTMDTCKPVISRCNETGEWEEYDAVTEAACHAYIDIYEGKYKNLFCYLCNSWRPYNLPPVCVYFESGPPPPSFSALLKFTASQEETVPNENKENTCLESEIFDKYEKICRGLLCLPPKVLEKGQCVDSVEYLTGVAYEAFINLVPNETVRIQDAADIAIELWDVYEGYIEKELGGTDVIYEHEMYYETMTRNDSVIYSFVLDLKVYFKYSHKHNSSNIFLNGLLSLQKKERHFISKSNSTYKMLLGYYDETVISFAPTDPPHKQQLILIRGILSTLYKRKPDIKPTLISKVLGCPLIRDDKHGTVSLKHETDYPPGSLITMNVLGNISVYVCVDDFLSSAAKRYTEQEKSQQSSTDNSVSAQGIMSLVCACISIVCLVLTLVTYAVFPELRTQPGINTIALVICLIAAQSLFQFGSQQSDSLSEWGCQTIGVLIHFFWLMVMFWMNVCSIHMYLVFINIDKITVPKYSLKQTIIYTTYTIMASMIFVIINIVVSIIRSDIEGMGYGGEICYITKYWMIGFVFSLPVGIIVVVNMSLFLAVVIRMWRMPTVKSETKHTRNIFAIFAKLSTLTGITWILGFAYVFTGFTTLEYIFIIFNASQGVFIFLAFVCNKRVLDMYRGFMARTKTCLSGRLTTKKTQTTNFTDIMQKGSHSNMSQGMVNGSVGFPTKYVQRFNGTDEDVLVWTLDNKEDSNY